MHVPLWFFFAFMTLLLFGLTGVTQKLATNEISTELSYVWFSLAMLVIALFIVILVPLDWHVRRKIIGLAIAGGVLNGLGCMASFKALEVGGKASIVVPLCYLYPLVAIFSGRGFPTRKIDDDGSSWNCPGGSGRVPAFSGTVSGTSPFGNRAAGLRRLATILEIRKILSVERRYETFPFESTFRCGNSPDS